jgi:oligopeptide/dipeptide ABC transporter ATP-binding protein
MTALLEARNVTKIYGGGMFDKRTTVALENLSLRIEDGNPSVTVVAGESGSGKTTLANLLLDVIEPSSGEILYRGKNLRAMSSAEHRTFRREVQAIFQDPFAAYNPFHKVDRVLKLPLRKFGLASSEAEQLKIIHEALELVGLRPEETLGRYPHQLSGGQRQRIMVARALVLKPRIIIADEPVSMVDASLRATILESLMRLNRELGISIIYITHDLTTAYQVGQSILVLYRGALAEVGDVELVIKQPQHPYTRLLVESIPLANPERRWGEGSIANGETVEEVVQVSPVGCKFVARCPHAMQICSEKDVPLYRTDEQRGVACFLYQDAPVMAEGDSLHMMSQIALRSKATATPPETAAVL